MTPEEHRAQAETLAAQWEAQPGALPEHHIALSTYAVAHALLAGPPVTPLGPLQTRQQPGPVVTFLVLLILAAVILGSVWMVTR